MKLIKQDFNIVNQQGFSIKDIKKHIEYCARISYKSQDKMTDTSYEKFVNMLVKKDHTRPLEFGTVHLKISSGMLFEEFLQDLVDCKLYNPAWIKYKELPEYTYITTNYRHYLQIIKECPYIAEYFTEQNNCYYPSRYTVHMILSRGVMDEFRTHVGFSHIAESTRWINYNRGKFGNEIICVIPHYCSDLVEGNSYDLSICKYNLTKSENLSEKSAKWVESMCQAEQYYMNLINNGCIAQEARDVLPLGVKSELISCGFEDAWSNFFYRRCAKDAHPMAREIAIPLQERFKELNYINQ